MIPPEGVPKAFSERRFKYLKMMHDTAAGWEDGAWSWEPSDDLYISNIEIGIFPIGVHEDCEAGVQIARTGGHIDPVVGGEETHGTYMSFWNWWVAPANTGHREKLTHDRKFTPPLFIAQLRPLYVSTYRSQAKSTMDLHVNIIIEYWTKK
ncbi:hypothetical protein ES705_43471 [subsurface metagenome]